MRHDKNLSNSSRLDKLVSTKNIDEFSDLNLGKTFCSMISGMKCWCCSLDDDTAPEFGLLKVSLGDADTKLINFDKTTMIANVSGISNGGIERLLATSESELVSHYKGNYEFVIAQVNSEIQSPVISELSALISGKEELYVKVFIQSSRSLFRRMVDLTKNQEPNAFKSCSMPDCPSTRLASLKTTRKLALKNKVVFGLVIIGMLLL